MSELNVGLGLGLKLIFLGSGSSVPFGIPDMKKFVAQVLFLSNATSFCWYPNLKLALSPP
jgi:hypothetical protein